MALITRTFNAAQVFYVDPTTVDDARTCDISSIDIYFKFRPDLTLNRQAGAQPGVNIFIAETMYGIPRITRDSGIFTGQVARLGLNDIISSSDATVPSTFRFDIPVTIETDKEYCFIMEYEMIGDYVPWTSTTGEVLTGTTNISPGPSDQVIGRFFDFNGVFTADDTASSSLDEFLKNWRPRTDTSLKFAVKTARYSHVGVPVGANGSIDSDDIIRPNPSAPITSNSSGINFNVNFGSYEFFTFNENKSNKAAFVGAQWAYQNTVYYPGGWNNSNSYIQLTTVAANSRITANTLLPNGATFQWSTIFPADNNMNMLVVTDGTTKNVRRVSSIVSNTVLELDEPISFSNSDAKFMLTPIGMIDSFNKASPFGVEDAILMLANSTANSTVRFVNNSIISASITAGGSGYNNDEIVYVTGFENVANLVTGGYIAVGNIVTNSTGGITDIHFSNLGCGFVNTAAITTVFANSSSGNTTGNTANGTSATFSYTVGADIRTEYGNNLYRECIVRNLDIGEVIPFHNIQVPPGVGYTLKLETNYIKKANTSTLSGDAYYVNDGTTNNQLDIVLYDSNSLEFQEETPVVPSKSNEYHLLYEDGSANDKLPTSNAASNDTQSIRLLTDSTANSDYSTIRMQRPFIQFSKYSINNDATNEHTDTGNAYAKGLTKVIDFKRTSEDVRVYLTAYKPANTDLKVYARIYKNEDPEAFDDKNWTELELKDGVGLVSSQADPLNYIQLEYGFYQVPQTRTALDGTITIATGDATVTGANTDFVTDLAAGDLVYMYQPLFVENHLIAAVDSVTNTTAFEMDTTTSNSSLLAEGMKIEKITYPEQAFNNKQNSNVVRYYNGSQSKFDGYESIAVKIVFLSSDPQRIPRVDDIQITGVSA